MRTGVSPKRIATRILSSFGSQVRNFVSYGSWRKFVLHYQISPRNHRFRGTYICITSFFIKSHKKFLSYLFLLFCYKGLPLQQSVLWPVWFPILVSWQINSNTTPTSSSLERRWSSRTFRYGYLVTTSPQLSDLPSTALSLRLRHWLRAFPTPMVWRAVCTRPGNVFTATFWFAITSDSSFM